MDWETIDEKRASEAKDATVSAGQSLKIETTPGGSEVFNEECPAGKEWTVKIYINITETDA